MATTNFNLRNISQDMMSLLKKEAAEQKISVNSLILQTLEREVGISWRTKKTIFHDLDDLAGTWSDKDKKNFDEKIKSFEAIDKELW